jgi:hypothetical protein
VCRTGEAVLHSASTVLSSRVTSSARATYRSCARRWLLEGEPQAWPRWRVLDQAEHSRARRPSDAARCSRRAMQQVRLHSVEKAGHPGVSDLPHQAVPRWHSKPPSKQTNPARATCPTRCETPRRRAAGGAEACLAARETAVSSSR